MVHPKLMCSKHLRGEYVECLMIAGSMRLKRKLDGFFAHNCIEPKSVVSRFSSLKKEMLARGFRARKTLSSVSLYYLPKSQQNFRINRKAAFKLLQKRCLECRRKMKE